MNMTPASRIELLGYNEEPGVITGLIERGTIDEAEMVEVSLEYLAFLDELEKEWPEERIKEFVINAYREKYKATALYIKKLELDNRDARVRGVSYKERQRFHKNIELGAKMLAQIKAKGIEAKGWKYGLSDCVQPLDMLTIKRDGMEKHLVNTYVF